MPENLDLIPSLGNLLTKHHLPTTTSKVSSYPSPLIGGLTFHYAEEGSINAL